MHTYNVNFLQFYKVLFYEGINLHENYSPVVTNLMFYGRYYSLVIPTRSLSPKIMQELWYVNFICPW